MREKRQDQEHDVDEASEESFPASDPPSHGGVTPAPGEMDEPEIDPELAD